jgi:hypothetical protein
MSTGKQNGPRYTVAAPLTVRLVRAHHAPCIYADSPEVSDGWYLPLGGPIHLDAAGRRNAKGRGYRWLAATCADDRCPALAYVRADSVERLVAGGLRA